MIAYEFEDVETGERREFAYRIGRAPKIGRTMRREGRKWRRLPPSMGNPRVENIRFTSHWFSPWTKGAKSYTPDGLPQFTSLAQCRDMAKRYGYQYDY